MSTQRAVLVLGGAGGAAALLPSIPRCRCPHDFECVSPAFDDVLVKLDAVPWGSPAKKEAKGLATVIREKRAAAPAHQ